MERLVEIIKNYSKNETLEISRDTDISMDLGLDSMDILNIITDVEDEYNITIDDKYIGEIRTVGSLLDVIEKLK